MKNLAEVFEHGLQDVYYAENQLVEALGKASAAAANKEFKHALGEHIGETKWHIEALGGVFSSIGKEASAEKCDGIEGLIQESEGIVEDTKPGAARDAALIGCCQAIEHYEIARYGTLREWAKVLGYEEAHELLSKVLDQEKAANNKLTNLAVSSLNRATWDQSQQQGLQNLGNLPGHQPGQGGKEDQLQGGNQQPIRSGTEPEARDKVSRPVKQQAGVRSKDQPPSHQVRDFHEPQLAGPDGGQTQNRPIPEKRSPISTALGEKGRGGPKGGSQESGQKEYLEKYEGDPEDRPGPVYPP